MLLATLALAAPGAVAVQAAPDPAEGEVSAASPTTSFSGSITEPTGAAEILFVEQGTSKGNCEEPYCQEFALTVKDAGTQLQVKSDVDEDGFSQTIEIEDPSGAISQTSAADPGNVTARVKNPQPGAWLIRIYGSDYINESPTWTYTATVTLSTAGAPAPPAPAPGPSPSPEPTPPPSGGEAEATLTVKRGTLSARKANRKRRASVTLTASAPLESLQVALSTGKRSRPKLVGRARLARLDGTRRVNVKLSRRIKRGLLTVSARAVDAQGRPVTGSGRLRVKR